METHVMPVPRVDSPLRKAFRLAAPALRRVLADGVGMTTSDALEARSNPSGGRMLAAVRHARIMEAFERNGFISVTDIARQIGVSAMTIRRDLVVLAQMGLLVRTHG